MDDPSLGRDFRDDEYRRRRYILEDRLISVALDVLRAGMDVVLDFGCWAKPEPNALAYLAASAGAECELVYVTLPPDEQGRRVTARREDTPATTLLVTGDELDEWRDLFEVPGAGELEGGPLDQPPTDFADWGEWAAKRWPSLAV